MKDNTDKLATHSNNRNIIDLYRSIFEFKKGYQSTTNLVKGEKDDLLADFHNVLNKQNNYFSQLLNVHVMLDRWKCIQLSD
jgi:hypothetical protein